MSANLATILTESAGRDPENTAKEIAALGVRFPVGPTQGIPGGEDGAASAVFTDAEAEALAQMSGVSKEALLS